MANEKYRVHEVAKDFNLPTKTITEILTKYVAAPKNHMQVLTDHELSVIFDYLTVNNQVPNIQAIYADAFREEKKEQPKAAPAPQQQNNNNRPQQQGQHEPGRGGGDEHADHDAPGEHEEGEGEHRLPSHGRGEGGGIG